MPYAKGTEQLCSLHTAGSFHSLVPCYFCRVIGVEVLSVHIFPVSSFLT